VASQLSPSGPFPGQCRSRARSGDAGQTSNSVLASSTDTGTTTDSIRSIRRLTRWPIHRLVSVDQNPDQRAIRTMVQHRMAESAPIADLRSSRSSAMICLRAVRSAGQTESTSNGRTGSGHRLTGQLRVRAPSTRRDPEIRDNNRRQVSDRATARPSTRHGGISGTPEREPTIPRRPGHRTTVTEGARSDNSIGRRRAVRSGLPPGDQPRRIDGRYRLTATLGRRRDGTVWRVRRRGAARSVAIKDAQGAARVPRGEVARCASG